MGKRYARLGLQDGRLDPAWAFSRKQLTLMYWWRLDASRDRDGLIAYGAVRSGKSLGMSLGFLLWAMSCFSNQTFAICGKSIGAVRRNVINPLLSMAAAFSFGLTERKSENLLVVSGYGVVNKFYIFGGNDESSQGLIQGITLAGVLFDEATLLPQSFVNQALARCSVRGSRFWFNCNPEAPSHWFKVEFMDKSIRRNLAVMHFKMDDNASLSADIIERYKRSFSGVFYRRYIEGEWAISEGLVYPDFSDRNLTDIRRADLFDDDGKYKMAEYPFPIISMDYGTVNPTAMLLIVWSIRRQCFIVADEFYYDGHQKTQIDDNQKYAELCKLAEGIPLLEVIIDPSAASFIALVLNARRYKPVPARNEVIPGIAFTLNCLNMGKYVFSKDCRNTFAEFGQYSWDSKAAEKGIDQPLKRHDHAMDALRYHAYTFTARSALRFGINTMGGTDRLKNAKRKRDEGR